MTRAGCSNLVLVEARRDGRLAASDVASLDRHLRTCAECTAHAAMLDRIGDALRRGDAAVVSPLDHRRARAKLLRAATTSPAPRSRRVLMWAPAAALLAAAVIALVALPSESDDASTTVAANRTETRVIPEDGARFERTGEGAVDRVDLDDGAVRAEVRKLAAGERFIVRTRDAEVEVRGTIFRVEARSGSLRAVDVQEGAVEVRVGDAKWRVEAGGTWRPAVGDAEAVKSNPDRAAPSASASSAEPPPRVSPSAASSTPRATATPRASVGMVPPPPPPPRSAAPASSAPSRSLQEAIAAIERGDYGQAASRLEKARSAEADPERAELALYLHAVALQRAGRPDEARRVAGEYLARHPAGRFVREAQQLRDAK